MRKIQSTIDSCSDCQFAKEFQEKGGNTDFVLICTPEIYYEEEKVFEDRFLITSGYSPILKGSTIPIPKNCPLEDYKSTET